MWKVRLLGACWGRRWARWMLSVALAGVLASRARGAAADAAAPPEQAPGVNTHDGFYFRFASGFGGYDEMAQSHYHEPYGGGGKLNVRVRGFSIAHEFALGGTPYPGLVIGGGVYSIEVVTSTVTSNRDDDPRYPMPGDMTLESRSLDIIGVFADRYFVPTLGLHLQAALGLAQQVGFSLDGGTDDDDEDALIDPLGPGLALGLGYEIWIAEQWSLGVLARATTAVLFSRDDNNVRWTHLVWSWPTFLMTVTYH